MNTAHYTHLAYTPEQHQAALRVTLSKDYASDHANAAEIFRQKEGVRSLMEKFTPRLLQLQRHALVFNSLTDEEIKETEKELNFYLVHFLDAYKLSLYLKDTALELKSKEYINETSALLDALMKPSESPYPRFITPDSPIVYSGWSIARFMSDFTNYLNYQTGFDVFSAINDVRIYFMQMTGLITAVFEMERRPIAEEELAIPSYASDVINMTMSYLTAGLALAVAIRQSCLSGCVSSDDPAALIPWQDRVSAQSGLYMKAVRSGLKGARTFFMTSGLFGHNSGIPFGDLFSLGFFAFDLGITLSTYRAEQKKKQKVIDDYDADIALILNKINDGGSDVSTLRRQLFQLNYEKNAEIIKQNREGQSLLNDAFFVIELLISSVFLSACFMASSLAPGLVFLFHVIGAALSVCFSSSYQITDGLIKMNQLRDEMALKDQMLELYQEEFKDALGNPEHSIDSRLKQLYLDIKAQESILAADRQNLAIEQRNQSINQVMSVIMPVLSFVLFTSLPTGIGFGVLAAISVMTVMVSLTLKQKPVAHDAVVFDQEDFEKYVEAQSVPAQKPPPAAPHEEHHVLTFFNARQESPSAPVSTPSKVPRLLPWSDWLDSVS